MQRAKCETIPAHAEDQRANCETIPAHTKDEDESSLQASSDKLAEDLEQVTEKLQQIMPPARS